jgi:dTDP-4-amino-4,6-dideoxygalactose transaminase
MKVPLLDLKAQYQSIRDEIKQAVEEVLESQYFILGPKVEALEKALASYCDCDHTVGVSSGTDALLMALMVKGVGPGHGVITVPYTFFSTAGCISRLGARPFFVDIDSVTYNMDPEAIKTFIETQCRFDAKAGTLVHQVSSSIIRAIIPVHLYGQCADMDPIMEIARNYDLVVIEDAAQAIGVQYPSVKSGVASRAGSMGHFGCFSFFPSKNLGGLGDGGVVSTKDGEMAERLKILRVHGSKPKYYHGLVGGNFRLDAIQAAALLVKLKYLDSWTAERRQNATYYNSLFQQSGLVDKGLIATPRAFWDERWQEYAASHIPHPTSQICSHIYNQYVIRARSRDELRAYLREQNIGTEIYYPLPLHQQECFAELNYGKGDFPQSEKAAAETVALPIYPELTTQQQEYVVDRVTSFYGA